MIVAYFVTTTWAGSSVVVAAERSSFTFASALRAVVASSRVCAEKELLIRFSSLFTAAADWSVRAYVWFTTSSSGARALAGRPPPALGAEPDVADGRVPFVLQTLGEDGDVGAERGELLNPPVDGGAARVGEDRRAAQHHSGQRGDGDQQDQAGTHPPVLQGTP